MTLNQIRYWELQEAKRTNRANENIKDWANKANYLNTRESIAIQGREADTHARQADIAQQEADTHRGSLDVAKSQLLLNERDVAARERAQAETKRSNLTKEYYQSVAARQQTRSLDQQDRALTQKDRALDIDTYGAVSGRIGVNANATSAQANLTNAYTRQQELGELIRHNQQNEQLIPSQIVSNYGSAARNVTPAVAAVGGVAAATGANLLRQYGVSGLLYQAGKVAKPLAGIAVGAGALGAIYQTRKNVALDIVAGKQPKEVVD